MESVASLEEQIVNLLSNKYDIEVLKDETLEFNDVDTVTLKFKNDFDIDLIRLEVKHLNIRVLRYSNIVVFRHY